MTMNPNKKDVGSEKEDKMMTTCSSSRQWSSSFKNPRIVRVSRNFGGKDRHSKVCTVRGLRDRRIRLSVPTAIQLYDLQDRLGLSQPSKVIDWLLDVTKLEIDKLPPLPMLPSNFLHYFHQPSSILANNNNNIINHPSPPYVPMICPIGSSQIDEEGDGAANFGGFAAHNFFPLNTVPNLGYNSSYFQLDTSPNLSLSQFGGGFSLTSQAYMCPSATSIISPAACVSLEDDEFRQINHLQSVHQNSVHHFVNSPIKSSSLSLDQNKDGKQDQHRSTSLTISNLNISQEFN